jgi:hypothetical protein
MEDLLPVYASAAVILLYFFVQVARKRFDPFAPVWLFLVGFLQVYVVQALSCHDWAVEARGKDLVASANLRAFWALLWFLFVYQLGIGRVLMGALPGPPRGWSTALVGAISPPLIFWGLFCAGMVLRGGASAADTPSAEGNILLSFPFVMMVAGVLLIVTSRAAKSLRTQLLTAGLLVCAAYVLIWMFNGKRSHSLIGVLATVCAFYITQLKRPSWPVLVATGFTGALVVTIAIGWRGNLEYEQSLSGFVHYLGDFKVSRILDSLNVRTGEEDEENRSRETDEYGGFLLMMDTVPQKSGYDHGQSYIRVFSTFIPRVIWPSKPLFGRAEWVNAWIAGSEMERDEDFTGPAIGILGACQLNGGAVGTLIVLACIAILLRTAYEYFRAYADVPWVQFWWSITFYNAWFMVVCDDPLIWFYYNWGFTTCPIVVLMWWCSKSRAHESKHNSIVHTAI